MSFLRDLTSALREGMDDLLHPQPERDGIEDVLALLEADLNEARSELEVALRDEKRLKSSIDRERLDAERLRERAQQAVDQGNDDLGRDLVRRRRRALRGVEILERQWTEHQDLITVLERHIDELDDKLQEMRLRSDFLRTRHRVTALRERYERYRREYGLDPQPLDDPDDEIEARIRADVIEQQVLRDLEADEEADDEPPTEELEPPDRIAPEQPAARLPEPTSGGRAEMPAEEQEPALVPRRRRRERTEPEPSPWDRPARDLTLERERMLRDIERKYRDSDDNDIEAELRRMKGDGGAEASPAPAEPPAAPSTPTPEPAPAGEADDGPGGTD